VKVGKHAENKHTNVKADFLGLKIFEQSSILNATVHFTYFLA